jgi:UDP-glucuronate 4-epimerase
MAVYLVTGAAGFIGSRVAGLLLANGHSVIGVDNLNDAYDPRLKDWRLEQLAASPCFRFTKLDVSNWPEVERLEFPAKPDGVVNLAARAGVRQSVETPWIYIDANVTGTLNLLELCRRRGIPKFVLASTSSLYGAHNPLPYREDADTTRPLSPYAASKGAAESLCHSYHHLHGLDISVLRYFTVYGPAGRPDMSVFRFTQWIAEQKPVTIYGDGSQSRDFTYVDDVARGTIAALKPCGFKVMNLGSDHPLKLVAVLHEIERLVGGEARLEFRPAHEADVPATWADISAAREFLGWRPTTGYREGLENAVRWYMDNREWASAIRT